MLKLSRAQALRSETRGPSKMQIPDFAGADSWANGRASCSLNPGYGGFATDAAECEPCAP